MARQPPASSDTVVELRAVAKTYRLGQHVIRALQGVDLAVRRGEVVALTGPSGSGKSTLLNLAGLIDQPDQGEIHFRGQRVSGIGEREATLLRRDAIGFVFQGFNLVPVMTVADNVDYPLLLADVPLAERRERVAQMLRAVGLHERASRERAHERGYEFALAGEIPDQRDRLEPAAVPEGIPMQRRQSDGAKENLQGLVTVDWSYEKSADHACPAGRGGLCRVVAGSPSPNIGNLRLTQI